MENQNKNRNGKRHMKWKWRFMASDALLPVHNERKTKTYIPSLVRAEVPEKEPSVYIGGGEKLVRIENPYI